MVHAARPGPFRYIRGDDAAPLLAGLDVALHKGPGLCRMGGWRVCVLGSLMTVLLCSLAGTDLVYKLGGTQ